MTVGTDAVAATAIRQRLSACAVGGEYVFFRAYVDKEEDGRAACWKGRSNLRLGEGWLAMAARPGLSAVGLTDNPILAAALPALATVGKFRKPDDAKDGENKAGPSATASDAEGPAFRNREDELKAVLDGIDNAGGPHFWLVTAPPQMGKTWFVNRVRDDASSRRWDTGLIDLRTEPIELRSDTPRLLARLFGLSTTPAFDSNAPYVIARQIFGNHAKFLCLVDSAELLDPGVAADLRSCLTEIYRLGRGAFNDVRRLALVVACRHEGKWRSAAKSPRLTQLTLTEFSVDIVQDALSDLATTMGANPHRMDLQPVAELVHHVSEGLPALLSKCLTWIMEERGIGVDRLGDQGTFEQLVEPYIKEDLFSLDSLFPRSGDAAAEHSHVDTEALSPAMAEAYRVLAPYRLFTQSHLRYHLETEGGLGASLASLGWSLEDLWAAISDSALLQRPLDEPWQEIQPAIRRILYRYFYKSPEQQASVNERALEFVEVWRRHLGKEQIVGLVECLWHQVIAHHDRGSADFVRGLISSASSLSRDLRASDLYTVEELRRYAAERMQADQELAAAVSHVDGLFDRLVETVEDPPES